MEEKNHSVKAQTKIVLAKYKRCSTDNQDPLFILQEEILDKEISRMIEDNPDITYEILNFVRFCLYQERILKDLDSKE